MPRRRQKRGVIRKPPLPPSKGQAKDLHLVAPLGYRGHSADVIGTLSALG